MSAKVLVSGLAGSGKTSLIKDLEDVLVISIDGKSFPLDKPYIELNDFETVANMISRVEATVGQYHERYDAYPKTVVFDSVSKIFDVMATTSGIKFTGFNVYSELNKEVSLFTSFLENTFAANGINLVLISHALWDKDTNVYSSVAQGSFAKRGAFYAEVDEAVFIEPKSNKRIVHMRNPKYLARTLIDSFEDSIDSKEFNLQKHLEDIVKHKSKNKSFSFN